MKKILFSLIALLGIVACEENNSDLLSQTLRLSADKVIIVANGSEEATFSVKDSNGAEVADAQIYFAATNEALSGYTFKTKYAGEYTFYAKRGNERSNSISIVATAANDNPDNPDNPGTPGDDPEQKRVVLTVSPTTIYADGVERAAFVVKYDGKYNTNFDVYNAASNSKLASNEFSTTEAGIYTFYAICEGVKSNTVEVTARMKIVEEEKPITLSTSATTIKANGVDYAKLTVMQDGSDVTSSATIYVNNGKLNGSKFSTTAAGTYTVYAMKGTQISESVTITAEAVTGSGTSTVFAEGVTISSGWYDVNKKSTTQQADADAMMCWAASSSNIVQWFQDRYVAAGNSLPAGCPNGTSSTYKYELQIMDVYRDNWENLARGNWTDGGVIWYFEGQDIYKSMDVAYRAYPKSGTGGYFNSVWSGIAANMHKWSNGTYAMEINNYSWGGSDDPVLEFSRYIVDAFRYGMSSMAVAMSSNFNGGHAVTIWGYEIDNTTDYITKLYITDSDDGSTPILREYTVKACSSGLAKVMLQGYSAYYPFSLYPIAGYNSANR